jgi:hypothetical protein
MVHDSRGAVYAEEARTRLPVVATAVADSTPVPASPSGIVEVQARWRLNGTDYTGELEWNNAVKANDTLPIWVDQSGQRADPPSPASRAMAQAILAGAITMLTAILSIAGMLSGVRLRVAGMRDAQWETDIATLNKGGRSNTSQ